MTPKLGLLLVGSDKNPASQIADQLGKLKAIGSGEVAMFGLESADQDGKQAMKEYSITSAPACVLMTPEGKVLSKHEGEIDAKLIGKMLASAKLKTRE